MKGAFALLIMNPVPEKGLSYGLSYDSITHNFAVRWKEKIHIQYLHRAAVNSATKNVISVDARACSLRFFFFFTPFPMKRLATLWRPKAFQLFPVLCYFGCLDSIFDTVPFSLRRACAFSFQDSHPYRRVDMTDAFKRRRRRPFGSLEAVRIRLR